MNIIVQHSSYNYSYYLILKMTSKIYMPPGALFMHCSVYVHMIANTLPL